MNKLSFILLILGMFAAEALAAQSSCPMPCNPGACRLKSTAAAQTDAAAPATAVAVSQSTALEKTSCDRPCTGKAAEATAAAAAEKNCIPVNCDPSQCVQKPACAATSSQVQSLMAILVEPEKE